MTTLNEKVDSTLISDKNSEKSKIEEEQLEFNKTLIIYLLKNKNEKKIENFIESSHGDVNYFTNEYNPLYQLIMYYKRNKNDSFLTLLSFLASHGANFNIEWKNKNIPLFDLLNLDLICIKKALIIAKNNGANMYQCDKEGKNLLMRAIESRLDISIIKYLYSLNYNLSQQDNKGNTIFLKAVDTYDTNSNNKTLPYLLKNFIYNNKTIINFILMGKNQQPSSNSDIQNVIKIHNNIINIKNNEGYNALLLAVKNNQNSEILNMLIDLGAHFNMLNENSTNLIMTAVQYNSLNSFKYFLNHNIKLNVKNENNDTLLMIATKNDNLPMVNLLLYGLNPNNETSNIKKKNTTSNKKIIHELKKNIFNNLKGKFKSKKKNSLKKQLVSENTINSFDSNKTFKKNTDDFSSNTNEIYNDDDDDITLNIENSKDNISLDDSNLLNINEQNNDGDTALLIAIKNKNSNIVNNLVICGADTNLSNNKNETPLMAAVRSCNDKIFDQIIEAQDSINHINDDHETALMIAIKNNLLNFVLKLLKKGADITIRDNDFRTPMMNASIYLSSLKYILRYENNTINLKDKNGKNALLLAIENKNLVNANILLNYSLKLSDLDNKMNNALMIACKLGLIEIVNNILILLNNGNNNDNNNYNNLNNNNNNIQIHIDDKNINFNTALMKACKYGHEEIVKILIDNNAKLDLKNRDGNTALLIACKQKQLKIINILLEAGADINCYNNEYINPIIEICNNNLFDSLENLFDNYSKKVKFNYDDQLSLQEHMNECFINIVENGRYQYISYFIDNGFIIDVSERNNNFYNLLSAIMTAFKNGYYKAVELILSQEQFKEVSSEFRQTNALIYACRNFKTVGIDLLLKYDFNVNTKDEIGSTPLIEASSNSSFYNFIKEFVKRGAEINVINNEGTSALLNSCKIVNNNIFKYLVDKGANIYISDNEGNNALMYAACYGEVEKMSYLLKKRININSVNNDGDTSLMQALKVQKLTSIKYLISHKADLNIINKKQQNALVIACLTAFDKEINIDYIPIIKSLIQKKSNINIPVDEYGNSLLMFFIMKNITSMAKYLIDYSENIDLNKKNNLGYNAMTYALKCNNKEIVQYLLMKNVDIRNEDDYGNDMVMYSICCFRY
ncbi:ankyrin [Anaeromyces robustus]|uniref:Ankyrin n=1 Tax=Anaeromyces robustus TaxID=1754192 RepID=A0A1Y1W649_9FUNG|nr:ankyrin [Anaeromyces robustus]|eukprot:ORX68882.1 ankyrin [Anaeromyces robustus]